MSNKPETEETRAGQNAKPAKGTMVSGVLGCARAIVCRQPKSTATKVSAQKALRTPR